MLAQGGFRAQGERLLQALLEAQPESAQANNALAWALVARSPKGGKPDIERAIELARKAVSIDPKNREAWNTLGVALWRAGEAAEARKALETSRSLGAGGDTDPADWLVLAAIEHAEGRGEEARALYDKSAKWIQENRPVDPDIQAFRREVAQILGIEQAAAKASSTASKPAP
jgi:Flp pilus assembly protein TadD